MRVFARLALASFVVSTSLVTVGQEAQRSKADAHHPHWSYSGEGGPQHWGELQPDFSTCKLGTYQSPIDIKAAAKSDLPALQFGYRPAVLNFVDNGHTLMVTYAPGSTLTTVGKKYELKQFHFHRPSEERINGKPLEMVVHLVHADAQGHLAVVAALVKAGKENPLFATLWKHVPRRKEQPETNPDILVDAKDLLPDARGYYQFSGSLTTPPCTEGVDWYVLKTPIEASRDQISTFAKLYPNNARPAQPLHGRKIMETKD